MNKRNHKPIELALPLALVAILLLSYNIIFFANPLQLGDAQPQNTTASPTASLTNITSLLAQDADNVTNTMLPPGEDADNDALLNGWEETGIDVDNNGIVDLDLSALGADPYHKDIFVEVDYMQFHKPIDDAINNVIKAFDNASLPNPDNTSGINLHVGIDEQIPHQDLIAWKSGFDNIKNTNFGTANQRSDPNHVNIINAKKNVYHYALFIHTYLPFPHSSGIAELPGVDFAVSLGAPSWARDPITNHNTGNRIQQEGTFMHEFGHNLNLKHAGDDHIPNHKPNYLSVMNYAFQLGTLVPNRSLDYSRCALPTLNESGLDEPIGIGVSCPSGLNTIYGPIPCRTNPTGSPVDWNRDGDVADAIVQENIVCDSDDSAVDSLHGYDDWSNLQFTIAGFSSGASIPEEIPQEITTDIVKNHTIQLLIPIYNDLLNLSPQSFDSPDEDSVSEVRNFFDDAIANRTSTDSLINLIQSDDPDKIDSSIEILSELRDRMDSSINGTEDDDLIVNSTAQQEIVPQIDTLIQALENQR